MTGASSTLPAIPPPASKPTSSDELTGIPNKTDDHILPDLVLEQEDPDTTQAASTEEEMDAAAALLSLGEIRDDILDDNNKNAKLMPIAGPNVPVDIALQPIHLDQLSVDNAITEMIQENDQSEDTLANTKTEEQAEVQAVAASDDTNKDNTIDDKNKQELATKGTLQTKTYTLKKKTSTKCRSFKCSECDVVKKSVRELNIHHEECHIHKYVPLVGSYLNSPRALQGICTNIMNPSIIVISATTTVNLKVNYRCIKLCTERTCHTNV